MVPKTLVSDEDREQFGVEFFLVGVDQTRSFFRMAPGFDRRRWRDRGPDGEPPTEVARAVSATTAPLPAPLQ